MFEEGADQMTYIPGRSWFRTAVTRVFEGLFGLFFHFGRFLRFIEDFDLDQSI